MMKLVVGSLLLLGAGGVGVTGYYMAHCHGASLKCGGSELVAPALTSTTEGEPPCCPGETIETPLVVQATSTEASESGCPITGDCTSAVNPHAAKGTTAAAATAVPTSEINQSDCPGEACPSGINPHAGTAAGQGSTELPAGHPTLPKN